MRLAVQLGLLDEDRSKEVNKVTVCKYMGADPCPIFRNEFLRSRASFPLPPLPSSHTFLFSPYIKGVAGYNARKIFIKDVVL